MLKVLLVDDEPFILQGLAMMIDWEGEGFEIVGKVSNAREALKVLKREQPHLVIADIKMPQMTGLEFLEKVRREKLSDAYFVILSGYSDFDYVRTALLNECLDYMLKPVDRDELLMILGRVRKMHEQSEKKKLDDSLKEKEVFSRNIIPVIFGKYDEDNIAYVKQYLGECHGCRYICVELNPQGKDIRELSEPDKRKNQRELYQECLRLFPGEEYRCIFDVSLKEGSYDVGIIYSEELLDAAEGLSEQEYLVRLKNGLVGSVGFSIQVTVGNKVASLEKLSESGKTVLMERSFQGFEIRSEENRNWSFTDKKVKKHKIDELIHAIAVNEKAEIEEGTRQILEELKQTDEQVINMVVNYLMFELIHLASEQDENVNQQEVFRFIGENTFEQLNLEEGKNMIRLLLEYGDYLAQLRGNQSKGMLGKIEADLKENFRENLTLKDLGKKYFVNAAYLGQIFKKQYGESFKDYLNRIRIEEAAGLLLKTDKKVYEIAEEVGYRDIDYFINKFIGLKGCTPAKFRKQTK
ncbi:MAG: response regulator [Roseburia sp.]|nr:response regulator [Roseburia sp.]